MDRTSIESILRGSSPPYYDLLDIKASKQNFQILQSYRLDTRRAETTAKNCKYTLVFLNAHLDVFAAENPSIPIRDDYVEALIALLVVDPNPSLEAVINMAVEFSE